jgi:CelD/BcsL family acetyltransferase involved in cellulose biosynthesis
MSLRIRRIESEAEFAALADAWTDLAARSGQTSPFLSHDWFACCWPAVTPDRRPEVVVVEDGGHLVAALPLMWWKERRRGMPVRRVALLECPDTPFIDVLVGGPARPIAAALVEHLAARRDWDVASLQKLPPTSPMLKELEAAALPGRLPWRRAEASLSPYLAIAGDWEAFWKGTSQRFKKTCRNVQNRLERAGRVLIEEHVQVDPDGALFTELVELSRRSWKGDRGVAIATMPNMHAFFAALTRRATARGWLLLWTLRLDGRLVAMEYQLRHDGRVNALRADFDPALREVSPGSALNFSIARALFGRPGVHEYDMGPGLNDYKLRWASGKHEAAHLMIYRPTPYGRLLHLLDTRVRPVVRRVRERLG